MPDIEFTKDNKVKFKAGPLDIPRPHLLILKSTVPGEFENIALTKEQYEGILLKIEQGEPGVIVNGQYHDRFSIYKVK